MTIPQVDFQPDASGPLDGVRVLDLSRLVCGNMLTLQLADFGAEVVKVEAPGRGDTLRDFARENGMSLHWKVYGRNKKSITLNLKSPEAPEIILDLVKDFDVLVESFRFGYLERLGVGPECLLEANPRLAIVRISGFGQTGPYRTRPGFGTLVEAMSGFADRNGFPDREPVLPPLALADMIAGLYGAMATVIAIRNVEQNGGRGQVVDLSLLESVFSILGPEAAVHQLTGRIRERIGSATEGSSPRNVYATNDDRWIAMSASTQTMAERVLRAIGRGDMLDDPRFSTSAERVKHRHLVDEAVGGWIGKRSLAEAISFFEEAGVTAAPVYNIEQFLDDPHVQERGIVVELPDDEIGKVAMHQVTPRLSGTPGIIRTPAPALGEHNSEIYAQIGYSHGCIRSLRDNKII